MRRLGIVLAVLLLPLLATTVEADQHEVIVIRIDGVITQGTTIYVERALEVAEARDAPLLIVLDTPGGLVDATLEIDEAIANAAVPVLTFVGPRSAFAASAGTFILLMGHPSGMAPDTTIGSAQPITVGPDGSTSEASEKVQNFLVGRIRAIAERNGRDADTAERFITENLNLDAEAARSSGIVDLVAADEAAFLAGVHGRTARVGDGSVLLDTEGARMVEYDRPFLSRVVDILGNPQIAFVLLLVGTYALIFGLANPGTYVPETIGALLLLLGFLGLGLFSSSTAGVLLLLLAMVFFVAEVITPTHGVLTVAGVVALFFAAVLLIDEPLLPRSFLRTFYFVGLTLALASGGAVAGAVALAVRTRNRPTHDVLRGAFAKVIDALQPEGRVTLYGEIWRARLEDESDAAKEGDIVQVVRHEGLTLVVAHGSAGSGASDRDESEGKP